MGDFIWWAIGYVLIGLLFVAWEGEDNPLNPVVTLFIWPLDLLLLCLAVVAHLWACVKERIIYHGY